MTPFIANFCYADTQGNSFKAGLADAEFNTQRYIAFERLKEPDEQDLKFGFETPHIEIDDQGNSGYGLVEKVELRTSVMRVSLNVNGSKVLNLSEPFEVRIGDNLNLNQFVISMASIFGSLFVIAE